MIQRPVACFLGIWTQSCGIPGYFYTKSSGSYNSIVTLMRETLMRCRSILSPISDTIMAPSKEVFQELGWLTFTQRVQYHICVMVFKSLNGQAPEYLSNLLTKCSETNVRGLRSSKQETLKVPFARTTYYEKSFSVTGPKLWNSLPIQIRQSSNLITFKVCQIFLVK